MCIRDRVYTALIAFTALSVLLGIIGLVFSRLILILLNTPSDVPVSYTHLTEIGYSAFDGTTALTTITIPKTVTTAGNNVFNGSALKTATIENGATAVADNRCV